MDIDPYLLLAALALLVMVTAALAVRVIIKGLRQKRGAGGVRSRGEATALDYYTRTLRQAAEVTGGEDKLATALQVTPGDLRRWLAGEEAPPMEVCLAALDLITHGPRRLEKRRSRRSED